MSKKGSKAPYTQWLNSDVTDRARSAFAQCFPSAPTDLYGLARSDMPDPNAFTDAESFRVAYWQAEIWSKHPFDLGVDREEATKQFFFECEAKCQRTNDRLLDLWTRPIPEGMRSVLRRASRMLHLLFDDISVSEVVTRAGWGPGATSALSRSASSPQNKWVHGTHVTPGAFNILQLYCKTWEMGPLRLNPSVELVEGDKLDFRSVPKNAVINRPMGPQPCWNGFLQHGLSLAMRSRLQRVGLLKPYAKELHMELARVGSRDGFLATIDLKGASETISLATLDLWPQNMRKLFLDLRSPRGLLPDGSWHEYQKVSATGCGFTFEMETALFWAVCKAVSGHACVFGDDIVVLSSCAERVMETLHFLGFEANQKKTFTSGPFRESCGGHFFAGVDVTPPYIRKPIVGTRRLTVPNRVLEVSDNGSWCNSLLRPLWEELVRDAPKLLMGPKGVDGVLHMPFDIACPKFSLVKGNFHGVRLLTKEPQRKSHPQGGLAEALRNSVNDETFFEWERDHGQSVTYLGKWVGRWDQHSPWSG